MASIEWSSRFEVGHFAIDAEHRIFVGIIGKLAEAHASEEWEKFFEPLLVELLKYAEFHFCSEENIMLRSDYPSLPEHRQAHEALLAELRNRIFSLRHEFIDYQSLEAFLLAWFTRHTATEDLKLAAHLRERAAGGGGRGQRLSGN